MIKVVIDTNIIFSACLSRNSQFRSYLFNDIYKFYIPGECISEINRNLDKILKYSRHTQGETLDFLYRILSRIEVFEINLVPVSTLEDAYKLCKSFDPADTPFVALAIYLNAQLWTGDKIKEHLSAQGFNNFFKY